jgi:hypothetical protein
MFNSCFVADVRIYMVLYTYFIIIIIIIIIIMYVRTLYKISMLYN